MVLRFSDVLLFLAGILQQEKESYTRYLMLGWQLNLPLEVQIHIWQAVAKKQQQKKTHKDTHELQYLQSLSIIRRLATGCCQLLVYAWYWQNETVRPY